MAGDPWGQSEGRIAIAVVGGYDDVFSQSAGYVAVFLSLSGTVVAEEAVTVQSLVKQGFTIGGTLASAIGPSLFLQNKDQVYICFVVETPTAPTLTTRYCKPVQ